MFIESQTWRGLADVDMTEVYSRIGTSLGKSPVTPKKERANNRKHGVVKMFDVERGYGFIESGIQRFFFHLSECDEMDTAMIPTGLRVSYEIRADKRGRPSAANVKVCGH